MTAEAQREFVDAKILVYAFDSSAGQKQQAAQALLERLWENSTGCLSVQVLQEFFVTVTKKVAKPLPLEDATSRVREFATWRQRPTMWSPPLGCTPRRASGFGTR